MTSLKKNIILKKPLDIFNVGWVGNVGSSSSVGGWVELGRTTLGSSGDSIDVTSLPDKRYYIMLVDTTSTGGVSSANIRLNNDSGSNYSRRKCYNGGSEELVTNQTNTNLGGWDTGQSSFDLHYLSNVSSKEKLMIWHTCDNNSSGSGNTPVRLEGVAKWANTSSVVNQISIVNTTSGSFSSGDECVVLGWDPDDTHTDNFWEELASVELTGTADTISSGTITAKKYLWIQFYQKSSGACNINMTFNNDTGSNYARRGNNDGTGDFTSASASNLAFQTGDTDSAHFFNMFIINKSANEKLGISHGITQNTAGAGNAPQRKEQVHKWANTSAQITEIDIDNTDSGSYASGTILKVWGSN